MFALLFAVSLFGRDTIPAPVEQAGAVPAVSSSPVVNNSGPAISAAAILAPALPMSPLMVPGTVPGVIPEVAPDTTPRRPRVKAVEYSDLYETRVAIHKFASYATIPLFIGQYLTGQTLVTKGTDSPQWVKSVHPMLAGGVAALFGVNTATGVWNWWDSRADPAGRTWRTVHSALMLLSDAGFVYVGSLGSEAKYSGSARDRHRAAAMISGSMSLVSYVMMLSPFRQD